MRRKCPVCPGRFSRRPPWTGRGAFPPRSACTWTRTSGTGTAWSATTCPPALRPSPRSCAASRQLDRTMTMVVAAGHDGGDRPQRCRCLNEKSFSHFHFYYNFVLVFVVIIETRLLWRMSIKIWCNLVIKNILIYTSHST